MDLARRARSAEADADAYPDDRPECLLEAAWAWRRAGRPERALELLEEAPRWPDPFDRGMARLSRAETLAELGDGAAADRELALLWVEQPDRTVCDAAAEQLEQEGNLGAALRWFDRSVAQLTGDELAHLRGEDGWFSGAAYSVRGRRRVRTALGLAPDAMDLLDPERPADEVRARRFARQPAQTVVLFWPRAHLDAGFERWPELFDAAPPQDYWSDLELLLRRRPSGLQVLLVAAEVEEVAAFLAETGRHVAEAQTRAAFTDCRVQQGAVLVWPPGRNDLCWCGSGAKYKRCCLRV